MRTERPSEVRDDEAIARAWPAPSYRERERLFVLSYRAAANRFW